MRYVHHDVSYYDSDDEDYTDELKGSTSQRDQTAKKHRRCEHAIAYKTGSKRLFAEALNLYLKAMRDHNILIGDDKRLILLAIHGLTELHNYPLARVLIRLSFSYLTASEMEDWFIKAMRTQHDTDFTVPF